MNSMKEGNVVKCSAFLEGGRKRASKELILLIFWVEHTCFLQPADVFFYTAKICGCGTGCCIIRTGPNELQCLFLFFFFSFFFA